LSLLAQIIVLGSVVVLLYGCCGLDCYSEKRGEKMKTIKKISNVVLCLVLGAIVIGVVVLAVMAVVIGVM